ncbi:zinc-ribbon domain-containing protein [Sulfurovum sp.]|uniref:zinc-ribbon domain-containing protein n=1 Tax=Sulfurovum sp. TaxID=1969726 RepID=UPI0035661862
MALINCPECGKEVSDKTYKCPNCGFVINKPKRSITGVIFNFIFIAFNAIMILSIIGVVMTQSPAELETSGAATGMAVGMFFLIWIFLGIPLALMNYLTRPKAYE